MNGLPALKRVLWAGLLLIARYSSAESPILSQVLISSRAVAPGEVLLVAVTGHLDGEPPSGRFEQGDLSFFRASTGTYLALIGLDLDIATGTHRLDLGLVDPDGTRRSWGKDIEVEYKHFPIQQITVSQNFVTPNEEDAARAEREEAQLMEIFLSSGPERLFDGNFVSPIPAALSSRFGERRIFNNTPKAPHSGADLRALSGTPVRAAAGGKVVLVGDFFYLGKTVVLDHGLGVISYYGHLSTTTVRQGARVSRGDLLGKVGKTGRATGPHLHWALRVRKARVDPFSLTALDIDSYLALPIYPEGFKPSRAVHLTAWAAGSAKARLKFLDQLKGTPVNAVVVPLKEFDGEVYIPGVARAKELGTTRVAIPDPAAMLRDMRERNLHAIARIVVFKDNTLARSKPEWGVHRPDGGLWTNKKGVTWVDPYNRNIWEYNVDIASVAAALGFDEIQFDYIRFPSDGDTTQCRYSREDHSPQTAVEDLAEFLRYAHQRLKPSGVQISVAIFGMTTTARDDMGIGQKIGSLTELVDFVSPMMYPSHYARGEYGLKDPNREPYKVINRGLRDAKLRLGPASYKLRPYLQDFSLGFHYGPKEVRAEILAARKQGIESWILWNPQNRYTWQALQALEKEE